MHELFEAQVRSNPEATAVIYEDEQLTYGELNARANRLAHHLRLLGVRPDKLVALCVERSIEMVVGLLAVLKAGGAYVPLDPGYPLERLSYMLQDSAPVVVLTNSRVTEPVRELVRSGAVPVLDLDADAERWQAESSDDPNRDGLLSTHLAYVIYTSGSTGQPKGVMIDHQALGNLLWSMKRILGITAEDQVFAVTTLSFDIAALELYSPLICGARLSVIDRRVSSDGELLRQNVENFSPSLYAGYARYLADAR